MEEMHELVGKIAKETGLTRDEVVKRYLVEKVGAKPPEEDQKVPSTIEEFREMLLAQSMREMMRPKEERGREGTDTDKMFDRLILLRMLPGEEKPKTEKPSTMERILEFRAMKELFPSESKASAAAVSEAAKAGEWDRVEKLLKDQADRQAAQMHELLMSKRIEEVKAGVEGKFGELKEAILEKHEKERFEDFGKRIENLSSGLNALQTSMKQGASQETVLDKTSNFFDGLGKFFEGFGRTARGMGYVKEEEVTRGASIMDKAVGLGKKALEVFGDVMKYRSPPPKRGVETIPEGAPVEEAPPEQPPEQPAEMPAREEPPGETPEREPPQREEPAEEKPPEPAEEPEGGE